MKTLGNSYLRSEFKAHKSAKPEQYAKFYAAWHDYLFKIRLQNSNFGANLNDQSLKSLSEEQMKKLVELRDSSKVNGIDKPHQNS